MFTENILSLKSAEKRQQSLVWAGKINMCVAWITFNENQEKRSYIVSCVNIFTIHYNNGHDLHTKSPSFFRPWGTFYVTQHKFVKVLTPLLAQSCQKAITAVLLRPTLRPAAMKRYLEIPAPNHLIFPSQPRHCLSRMLLSSFTKRDITC